MPDERLKIISKLKEKYTLKKSNFVKAEFYLSLFENKETNKNGIKV